MATVQCEKPLLGASRKLICHQIQSSDPFAKIETDRVHELSIAQNLVTIASEAIQAECPGLDSATLQVTEVHLRLGRLAGVVKESLEFCYDVVTQDTMLEGSQLVIEVVPVVVYCPTCQTEFELPNIQRFRCPDCHTPTGDIRQGREMELSVIHFDDRCVTRDKAS